MESIIQFHYILNSEVLLLYCEDNDIKLAEDVQYEHIKNKLFIVYNKTNNDKYNIILSKIKELIKNTKNEI